MSDVEARLKRLEDIEAIRKLKARYLNACDLKQPDVVRDCFIADAVIDYGPIGRFEDADSFVDIFKAMGCKPTVIDMHHGANAEIEITGENEATARWGLYFSTMLTELNMVRRLGGFYADKYVRTDAGWKIAETVFTPQSILDGDVADDGNITWHLGGRAEA